MADLQSFSVLRRPRFGLRSVLLLTTLVGVVLGTHFAKKRRFEDAHDRHRMIIQRLTSFADADFGGVRERTRYIN
jgi:hypothetical protein